MALEQGGVGLWSPVVEPGCGFQKGTCIRALYELVRARGEGMGGLERVDAL